jgi:ABC-type glycerol-3-phosphate transport system substrate-binding protein
VNRESAFGKELGGALSATIGRRALLRKSAAMGAAAAGAGLFAAPRRVMAQDGPVNLVFWHHTYPPADEFIQQKIDEYTAENPNLSIELVTYPHGDYETKLLAAISAGDAPDIINLLDYLYPRYIARDLLAPVDPAAFGGETMDDVRALYVDRALEGLSADDTVYGVPEEFNTLCLFLNATHFDDIGLDASDPANWPETWEDLFAVAKELEQKDGDSLTRIGFNWVWNLDPYWYAQQYWPILRQYGANVLDEEGNAVIDSPEAVAMFTEVWQRLITDGMGGPAVATVNPVNALQDFSDGRQSMMIAGIWAPPAFRDNPAVYDNYVVAPLPQKDPANPHTLLNSYSLTVSAASEHSSEAWGFINYLTSDSGGYIEAAGYVTGRKGWAETPEAQETRGVEIFAEGQQHGSFVWRSETWTEEGTAIKQAIENFSQGGASVEDALKQAAEQINQIRGVE